VSLDDGWEFSVNVNTRQAFLFKEIFNDLFKMNEAVLWADENITVVGASTFEAAVAKAYTELYEPYLGPEAYALKRLKSSEHELITRLEELVPLGDVCAQSATAGEHRQEITASLSAFKKNLREFKTRLSSVHPMTVLIDYHFLWTDQHYEDSTKPARDLLYCCVEKQTKELFAEYLDWANGHLAEAEAHVAQGLSTPNDMPRLRAALSAIEVQLLMDELNSTASV
jgi:hypothetical protein